MSSPDPHPAPRPGRRYPPWARRILRAGRWRSSAARRRGPGWRLLAPVAFVGAGVLLVTSGVNAAGTDLRAGEYADLADLARQETQRVRNLQEEVAALRADVDRIRGEVEGAGLADVEAQIARLEAPAGLTAVEGPGLTITLQDAPEEIRASAGDQVANAIVHQQDIQAVVNALWSGGAEAMTLQGQRVVSTTGIKCVGNTVLLHGVTYSPPYVISAIGDVARMRASIESSTYIDAYLQAVDEWRLGWDLEVEDRIEAPAFDGQVEMRHARPATK